MNMIRAFEGHSPPASSSPAPALTADEIRRNGERLIAQARATHQHATEFQHTVDRYCADMPGYLDRFHEAMQDFRTMAQLLRASKGTAKN